MASGEDEQILFATVGNGEPKVWRKPRSLRFAGEISYVPLSDSEILQTSHHLPIAIDYVADGPRVIAITDAAMQRTPLLSSDGRWLRGYTPIALRCLPFRLARSRQAPAGLEVALNLDCAGQPEVPLFSTDGTLTPEVQLILALLQRLEEGKRELRKAAEMLLIADVLTPFQIGRRAEGADPARVLTVDRNKFAALSNSRVAHLVKDGFLPIDLACACVFSQRLMPTLVPVAAGAAGPTSREKVIATGLDEFVTAWTLDVQVDDSELFSFERFEEMNRAAG
jgi:hypothetical protein